MAPIRQTLRQFIRNGQVGGFARVIHVLDRIGDLVPDRDGFAVLPSRAVTAHVLGGADRVFHRRLLWERSIAPVEPRGVVNGRSGLLRYFHHHSYRAASTVRHIGDFPDNYAVCFHPVIGTADVLQAVFQHIGDRQIRHRACLIHVDNFIRNPVAHMDQSAVLARSAALCDNLGRTDWVDGFIALLVGGLPCACPDQRRLIVNGADIGEVACHLRGQRNRTALPGGDIGYGPGDDAAVLIAIIGRADKLQPVRQYVGNLDRGLLARIVNIPDDIGNLIAGFDGDTIIARTALFRHILV